VTKGKGKGKESGFIAPLLKYLTRQSGTDHTVLPANYTVPASPRKHSPDGASQTEVADI